MDPCSTMLIAPAGGTAHHPYALGQPMPTCRLLYSSPRALCYLTTCQSTSWCNAILVTSTTPSELQSNQALHSQSHCKWVCWRCSLMSRSLDMSRWTLPLHDELIILYLSPRTLSAMLPPISDAISRTEAPPVLGKSGLQQRRTQLVI